jgi:hypothetical protein
MANSKPEKKFVRGACSVSIFTNEAQKNGQEIRIPKAVFQKRYKDSSGEWQTTQSLDVNDIPKAVLALQEAYDHLTRRDQGEDAE